MNDITFDQAKRWLEDSTPNHWHSSWCFQATLEAIAERDHLRAELEKLKDMATREAHRLHKILSEENR